MHWWLVRSLAMLDPIVEALVFVFVMYIPAARIMQDVVLFLIFKSAWCKSKLFVSSLPGTSFFNSYLHINHLMRQDCVCIFEFNFVDFFYPQKSVMSSQFIKTISPHQHQWHHEHHSGETRMMSLCMLATRATDLYKMRYWQKYIQHLTGALCIFDICNICNILYHVV